MSDVTPAQLVVAGLADAPMLGYVMITLWRRGSRAPHDPVASTGVVAA